MKNTFQSKKNLAWFFRKVFSFYFRQKTLFESVKNLEISYYLLIILIFILKLLTAIYILFWIFFFQFHPLEFDFYINFGPHFYNYFFFPLSFLIEIFYLSNLIIIFLIITYFIWNNLWNGNYYYFNLFIFQIFYLLDLISIILILFSLFEIIYEIIFFSISFLFNFLICKIFFSLF
jgi:hypothetical protein